jgi:SAM-dependent methyltransferase
VRVCIACDSRFDAPSWACPECGHVPEDADGSPALIPPGLASELGFEEAAFADLWRVEQGCFWFRSRNRLLLWALDAYFPHARSFFEIGCGTGFALAAIEQARPELSLGGSDPFTTSLKFAKQRLRRAQLVMVDARRLPFDEEWDVVGAFDVLEHVDDDAAALREMYRSVRRGGGAIVTVPQHPWLWSPADEYARHERRYTRSEVVEKVLGAGFRIARVTSFMSLLLPLMIGSRLAQRFSRRPYDPMTEYASSQSVDRVFERIAAAELGLLRRGWSLPAGGSLLVVAGRD